MDSASLDLVNDKLQRRPVSVFVGSPKTLHASIIFSLPSLLRRELFPVKSFEETFVFQVFQQREVEKLGGLSSLEIGISVTQILDVVLERLLARIGLGGDCPQ